MNRINKYSQWIEWLQLLAISFFSALFAWYLVRFLTGMTTLYFCYDLNIPAVLNLSGVKFLIPYNSANWTRDAIVTIYLSGPILNFFLGTAFFIAYTLIPRKSLSFSFFMLWTMIFSFTMTFGIFVENGIRQTGIYRVTQLMHIGDILLVVSVVVALYFLYVIGFSMGKLILLNLSPHHIHNKRIKTSYFISSFVIPWLLVYFICFREINADLHIIYLLGLIILLVFIWIKEAKTRGIQLKRLPSALWIDAISMILFFIGFLILRQLLASGIVLG